jgi:hypothetical protein
MVDFLYINKMEDLAMKKTLIISTVLFLCVTGFANTLGTNWLETDEGKIDCKQINLGITKATVILEDGKTVDYSYDDINSISKDGKIYTKLLLFEDNKPTDQKFFMEFKKTWNDLTLYKLTFKSMDSNGATARYYLYKGTSYYLQLDERGLQNTCKEFGINYSSL